MKKVIFGLIIIFFVSCVKEASERSPVNISLNGKWKLVSSSATAYAPMNMKGPLSYDYTGPSGGGFFTIERDSVWTISDYNPVEFLTTYDLQFNNVVSLSIIAQVGQRATQKIIQVRLSDSVFVQANSRRDSIFVKSATASSLVLYGKSYRTGRQGIVTYSYLTFTKQ